MASGAGSELLIALVFGTGAAALGTATLLVLAIAVLRVRIVLRLARERRFAARWQPLFAACVGSVPEDLPPLAPADGLLFFQLWIHAAESMQGEARGRLATLAHRAGASVLALEMAAGDDPQASLVALVALGHLRARSLLARAGPLLQSPSPVRALAAAQALLRADEAAALPKVLAAVAARDDWPAARVLALAGECDALALGMQLSRALRKARGRNDGAALARLLRLAPIAPLLAVRGAVREVLAASTATDALAAALDALAHPEDVAEARRLVAHPDWVVRLAAVKALGRLGGEGDAPLLRARLADERWWVRYRAAQALAALPGMTREAFEVLRAGEGDRFAADMLGHVLAERWPA